MRDNWWASPRHTVAAWVGNFDSSPMWDVSGVRQRRCGWKCQRLAPQPANTAPAAPTASSACASPDAALEPSARRFLSGTEVTCDTASAAMRARIVYPARGQIIAIDPTFRPSAARALPPEGDAAAGLTWLNDEAAPQSAAAWTVAAVSSTTQGQCWTVHFQVRGADRRR